MGDKGTASPVGALLQAVRFAWSELTQTASAKQLSSSVRSWFGPIPGVAANKPANLIYGVEEEAPGQVKWLSAIQ